MPIRKYDPFQEELNGLPLLPVGAPSVLGSISTTFAFDAPASGVKTAKGSASTAFAFDAPASGVKTTRGSISTTFVFDAPASGIVVVTGFGTISTAFVFDAPASGVKTTRGAVSTTFAFDAPASGVRTAKGAISTTFAFSAPASEGSFGSISTAFAFDAPASGTKTAKGLISTTFAFDAPALGPDFGDFSNRSVDAPLFVVDDLGGPLLGNNIGASNPEGLTQPDFAATSGTNKAIWAKFVAPDDGFVMLSSSGSAVADTVMGIFTGPAPGSLVEVAQSDDDDGAWAVLSGVPVLSGVTYWVAITSYTGGDAGAFQVSYSFADAIGSIDTTFTFSGSVPSSVIPLQSQSTLFPGRVGATVGEAATTTHTVIAGTSVGTGVLTGDYAYRGLYGLELTLTVPTAGGGWVTLASWGDFTLRLRRDTGTIYRIRADFLTASAAATSAAGQLNLAAGQWSLGLGVTRDVTTGAIRLWRSDDSWLSWSEILLAESAIVAGALSDSGGEAVVVLGGDLSDGDWISVFQAQWAATDDINAMDAAEVAAWNYGANFTGTVGADAEAWEFGADATLADTSSSSTVSVDVTWTINADTPATSVAPAGTSAGYSADPAPQWETGPGASLWSSPIAFTSTSQFTVAIGSALVVPGLPSSPGSGGAPSVPGVPGAPGTLRENDGTPEPYRVVIVDMSGVVQHELPNAAVGAITWSLNEAESFSFTMPALDPLVVHITATDTEIQVWRGERMIVWGVVVRPLVNGSKIDYQCRGVGWYFTKRFIGGPRRNYLCNPSFETSGCWLYGAAPTEPIENTNPANWELEVTSEFSVAGFPGRSQRIWSNDEMIFGIQAYQFIFHEIDSAQNPDGITWTASAWVYIPSAEWGFSVSTVEDYEGGDWTNETRRAELASRGLSTEGLKTDLIARLQADDSANGFVLGAELVGERNAAYNWGGESAPFGLHLGRFSTTSNEDQDIVGEQYPEVYEITVAGLTEQLPRDEWVRIETSLVQDAPEGGGRRTDWIQVDLHCPLGAVYYDEVSLTRNERLFYNDEPQENIMFGLVDHAQSEFYGKSDLNIGYVATSYATVRRTRSYEFFNREFIADALAEFTTLWNGCDWSIETTPTARTFTPWFPMKGMRRPAQALTLGTNIAAVTIATDGEQIVNRAVVRSDTGGTGSSREEAIGTNTTGFTSDVVLEGVFNAAPESPLDSLEGQLEQMLRQKRDATIPTLTTHDNVAQILFGQVVVGDVVPVDVAYGGVSLQGDFRIMALTLNPSDETIDFVVNPFTEADDPAIELGVSL